MRIARKDLGRKRLIVVYPGARIHALQDETAVAKPFAKLQDYAEAVGD